MLTKKIKICIALMAILVFAGLVIIANQFYIRSRTTMNYSHIFVCDNPQNDSEFDTWMKEDLGLNWVPTYFIVRNDYVIGSIRGGVPESQFTSELGTILIQDWQVAPLPDLPLNNLNGERISLADALPNDNNFYIIEISWVTCPDCIFQDENFTDDIYLKYGTNIIYRYYIHSTTDEVMNKYS